MGIVLSYPKMGRSWLRFQLANYLCQIYSLPVEVDFQTVYSIVPNDETEVHGRGRSGLLPEVHGNQFPVIAMRHQLVTPVAMTRSTMTQSFVLLLRSPFDTIVSHWHHARYHYASAVGTISEFIRDEHTGIANIVKYCENYAQSARMGHVRIVTYERMNERPAYELEGVIRHFGLPMDGSAIHYAVERSSFENMQALEIARGMKGIEYDRGNPAALRVRQGMVGNFRSYLAPDDIDFITTKFEASHAAIALYRLAELEVI